MDFGKEFKMKCSTLNHKEKKKTFQRLFFCYLFFKGFKDFLNFFQISFRGKFILSLV